MGSFPETYHFINGTLTLGSERGIACEQALLFGRASRERASETRPNRRACSQAKRGRGSLIPYSRIPNFWNLYPEYRFLSQYPIPCQDFGESRLSSSGRISYPVKNFFVFPNPALCFGQISNPEGRYPSRPFDLMTHYCLQVCCLYFLLAIQTFQENLNSRPWFSHCFSASLSENVITNGTQHEIIRPVPRRFAVGSAGADLSVIGTAVQTHPQRTLINPFKPNEIPCNWTCNRHRWSHVFPTGPDGEILHPHYHKLSTDSNDAEVKLQKVPILKPLKGFGTLFCYLYEELKRLFVSIVLWEVMVQFCYLKRRPC